MFKSRLDNAEERISKLEHIGKEIIQKETHWEKYIKNKKITKHRLSVNCKKNLKWLIIYALGLPKGEKR